MKLKYVMPAIVIVLLLGSVLVAKVVGWWQTSGREMVNLNDMTPKEIKGWMPLSTVSQSFGIPLDELYDRLCIPPDVPPETPLKDMEKLVPNFEVSTVREVVAAYLDGTAEEPDAAAEPTPTHQPGTGAEPTPPLEGEQLPAASIKGRMTLQEVSDQCQIPLEILYERLTLPEDLSPATQLKTLKEQNTDFEVQAVRDIVTAYQVENP
jgi:hypothetical protein